MPIMPITTQGIVYQSIAQRGYLAGYTPDEVIQRQVLKVMEELGEVARHIFDGKKPPASELADVVIPMFVAASAMGIDLLAEVERKALADVERGVR